MFHVTAKLDKSTPIRIGITPGNVFTHCCRSGEEVSVNLAAVLQNKHFTPGRLYAGTTLEDGSTVQIPITDRNVRNFCIACGKEIEVYLSDFEGDEDFDVYTDEVLCDECAEELEEDDDDE